MRILSLDLGSRTGWAVNHRAGGEMFSGVLDLSRVPDLGWRFFKFLRWTKESLESWKPDLVLYEQPWIPRGADRAAASMLGYQAVLIMACTTENVLYLAIPPATVKKHATGSGRATKEQMVEAAQKKWGGYVTDDNRADALWLLDYGEKHCA